MAMEGKTLRKGEKTRMENTMKRSTSSLGSEYVDGEELGDDEGWN